MRYLSVCSGIEAATVAWHPLGWEAAGFSEIDKFPSAVLADHYPAVRNFGDFTTIKETDVGAIDLLVGGTPCQSFSVAGLRGGLGDDRGNLALEFCRLALRTRPRWLVWENVPGVLSSNGGRDFGSILGALAECGYGFAYRILDAQFFGLAQRRKRVFVVGYFGDWRPAAAVLFERESLRGDPAPRRGTGQRVAGILEARAGTGGYDPGAHGAASGHLIAADLHPTLRAGGNRTGGDRPPGTDVDTMEGLVCFDTTQLTSASNYSNPKPGDPCHPLAAGAHPPAVAISAASYGDYRDALPGETDDAYWIRMLAHETGMHPPAIAFESRYARNGRGAPDDVVPPLKAQSGETGKGDAAPLVAGGGMAVRRLTPRECERLQGFPDDYTAVPHRGKPAADGPRYRSLGNSMAVPVMRWIGERIQLIDTIQQSCQIQRDHAQADRKQSSLATDEPRHARRDLDRLVLYGFSFRAAS